jgi:hypothetical protein
MSIQLQSVTINPVHRAVSLLTACVAIYVLALHHDCPGMEKHLDWLAAYAGVELTVLMGTVSLAYLAPTMDAFWSTNGFFLLVLLSAAMQGGVTLYGAILFFPDLSGDMGAACSQDVLVAGTGLVLYHVIFFFISLFYRPFAYEWASPEEAMDGAEEGRVEWRVSARPAA